MTAAHLPSPTAPTRGRVSGLVGVALVIALLITGCTSKSGDGDAPGRANATAPAESASPEPPPPPKATVVPADGAAGVAPASPVTVELEEGELATVQVRSNKGDVVAGAIEAGSRRWASKGKLAFGSTYTVQVTTAEHPTPRAVGSFTTAAVPSGGNAVRPSSVIGDGKVYGVGMPVILKLNTPLASKEQRAAFERSLTVRSQPATAGAWGWMNDKEVHFRPTKYWAAGSKVHVTVDAAGREIGNGKWGRKDLTLDFKIGEHREMRADSKSHKMQVIENGKIVRTIPISLGRPKFPSSHGTMVVIEKKPKALFDSSTYGLPIDSPDGYRTEVDFPIRITWGGQFLHSAPWSVRQQGKVNVSHGCINLAPANAKWIYDRVRIGDPVTVTNTEEAIKWGDGWMAWSLPFAKWLTHSATGQQSTA